MTNIFYELGPRNSRRAYRMNIAIFWKLCEMLDPFLNIEKPNRTTASIPNGIIHTSIKVSIALRYFAGGSPLDIALIHGVSYPEVMKLIWHVIDVINKVSELAIKYPEDHNNQLLVAKGFESLSKAGFKNCAGCIDGILIWINKPTKHDLEATNIGHSKFYCGRKNKFGLNMQATCDANRRFLDVEIAHPGATSNYLSFQTSSLHHKLKQPNFLHPDLAIFGDNAYVNTIFMVTPYKGVSDGEKDAYNFYHSQLRINIECAFGMLVHRFGILQKAIPAGITIARTTAMVMCMCRLHNYCIDNNDIKVPKERDTDTLAISLGGCIANPDYNTAIEEYRPDELLDRGNHYNDIDRRQLHREATLNANQLLPREKMLSIVREKDLTRPMPAKWRHD